MNTSGTSDAVSAIETVKAALGKIEADAIAHFALQSSIAVLKMEVWLPRGVVDEENGYFNEFIETYRHFLAKDTRNPFCFWIREKIHGQYRYLCSCFLNDYQMPALKEYFKAAEAVWAKTLNIKDARKFIGRCQKDYDDNPIQNGIRLKKYWGDDDWVNAAGQQWVQCMYRQSCRVRNPKKACLVFGASYRH